MNANAVLTLDTRRARKDGTYPVILRLSHRGKTIPVSTGISLPEKYWDGKNRRIRQSYNGLDNITRANNWLEKQKAKALDIITRLKDTGELNGLSIKELKDRIVSKGQKATVFDFIEGLIADLIKKQKVGNARSYRNVLREIKNFRKGRDFTFHELNYSFLLEFERAYLSRGLSENGLAVYMRTIKAIYNKAIKAGLAEKENYPFDRYIIKTKPTKKRAIGFDAIQKIIDIKLDPDTVLFDTRNIFLMSFYLYGAPYIDLAFLKLSNIIDERVQYKRQKTGRFYDIKISPALNEILAYYTAGKDQNDYILPIIKRDTLQDRYKDVLWALNRYNKRLKQLAVQAGIKEKLTSYVSRHSFATIADNMEIPVTAISQMLGHEKLSTTQSYLAGVRKSAIDDYNQRIIGGDK